MKQISSYLRIEQPKEKARSERDFYVKEACVFLYGEPYTKKEYLGVYFSSGSLRPDLLKLLIREAKELSDFMWREKGIKTNPKAHFWVLLKKAKAELPKTIPKKITTKSNKGV